MIKGLEGSIVDDKPASMLLGNNQLHSVFNITLSHSQTPSQHQKNETKVVQKKATVDAVKLISTNKTQKVNTTLNATKVVAKPSAVNKTVNVSKNISKPQVHTQKLSNTTRNVTKNQTMNSTKMVNTKRNMTKQTLLVKNITANKTANVTKNQTKNVSANITQPKTQAKAPSAANIPVSKTEQEEKADPKSHYNDSRAKRVEIIQNQTDQQLKKLHKPTTVL